MKKLLAFVLVSVLLISFAACGAADPVDPGEPVLPPYLGKWELNISTEDGSVAKHSLILGENGRISYSIIGTYLNATVYEEEYSFYDWTEENGEITCAGAEYNLTLLYDSEKDTLTAKSSPSNVYKRAK